MSTNNPTHAQAADMVADYLPEYMASWIAGVLRETHTLPALIHHQDRLAQDVLGIAVSGAMFRYGSSPAGGPVGSSSVQGEEQK